MHRNGIIICIFALFLTACGDFGVFKPPQAFSEKTLQGAGADKIALIHITGIISNMNKQGLLNSRPSMLQEVIAQLRLAEKDPAVKAILLAINSPGGSVTASDILYHEISRIRQSGKKKIYTLMMDVAASGGYYIALASNNIIAHPTTITGSIGVIITRISIQETLDMLGIQTHTTKSGAMKDMGSISRQPTKEESIIVQNIINTMNERFQNLVIENRPLAKKHPLYKDGRILTAQEALSMGLIDSIGYFDDTIERIKKDIQVLKAKIITYQRTELPNGTEYNSMGMKAFAEDILPESLSSAGAYYLWTHNI